MSPHLELISSLWHSYQLTMENAHSHTQFLYAFFFPSLRIKDKDCKCIEKLLTAGEKVKLRDSGN